MPTVRYLGTNENILSLEALKNMYLQNFEHAQKKSDTKVLVLDRKLSEGDSILLKDHPAGVWNPRDTGDYWIISFSRKTQV